MATDVAKMTDAEKAAAFDALQNPDLSDSEMAAALDKLLALRQREAAQGPPRFRVVVSNKLAGDRTLFSSVSEKRARAHLVRTCPRGEHHFLLHPDGKMEAYEAERNGPQGEDVDPWQEFDREAYQAPDLSPVNTFDPWADAWEGAQ
jgi:hypothetical protein